MLRDVLFTHHAYARIAATPRGERRLTNLLQLGELLQHEQARLHAPDAVIGWLRRAVQQGHRGTDTELRLESDADLVQVRTVHTSKGLEYTVVFLPALWTARLNGARHFKPAFFHDAEGRAALDFDGDAHAHETAERESYEERLRLAYVALTRAKQRCYVVAGALPGIEASPLAWWLTEGTRHGGLDATEIDAALHAHARAAAGAVAIEGVAVDTAAPVAPAMRTVTTTTSVTPVLRAAAVFRRTGLRALQTASFSAIANHAPEVFAESPEHDEFADAAFAAVIDAAMTDTVRAPTIATEARHARGTDARFVFPRGAAAGDALHAVLETIDWQADTTLWQAPIAQGLASLGVEHLAGCSPDEVARWLADIAATPLPALDGAAPFALNQVALQAQRRELEFVLPLDDVDFAALGPLAREHGWPISDVAPGQWRGLLKGYIDLAFTHRGRWYVADYKSNWLGAAMADYAPDMLDAAMQAHAYRLQALLYTVALHRWLRVRLHAYDYTRHVGGAYWMFVRGMSARAPAYGVAAFTVPQSLVGAVDALFKTAA